MIEVSAKEGPRSFDVRVGDKLVGRVDVNHRGWITTYLYKPDGEAHYQWIQGGFKTISQAANRILRHAGYGNAKSCKVERVKGFRS